MSRKVVKSLVLVMTVVFLLTAIVGCGSSKQEAATASTAKQETTSVATTEVPKEIVTIKSIYPGDQPKDMDLVLAEINKKMGQDIAVNLELTWAPWDQYGNKITMGVAAGEDIDYIWSGSSDLASFAAKKIIAPIDEPMAKHGKPILDNINNSLFDTMKIGGKLMGIPSTGNAPLSDVYHVLMYRDDLRAKHSLPKPDSIVNMEAFFKGIKEKEPDMIPLCNSGTAYTIMKAFGPEDFFNGTNGAVAYKINEDKTVTLMNIQDAASFNGAVNKAREWHNAGYIPKDILNIGDAGAKLKAGAAAVVGGAALSASENQASVSAALPGAVLADQPIFGENKKYMNSNGGNALYMTSISKKSEQVVQFWSWVFTSQDNFDLYCYGIKDNHYEIKDNRIAIKNDGYAFPGWMFKNMNFLRFPEGISDEYIDSIKHWDDGAEISPLMGFTFNPENVANELAQVNSVFSAYSSSLYSGVVDPAKILPELKDKMKAAGQDKILEEAKKQVEAFMSKK